MSATEGGFSRCYVYKFKGRVEPVPVPVPVSINSNILYPKGATYRVVAIVILVAILVTMLDTRNWSDGGSCYWSSVSKSSTPGAQNVVADGLTRVFHM